MSRFVGFAYPDGLYILDTLTGKVSKVPTGEGPGLAFGDEALGPLVSGAHQPLRYPHGGVPQPPDSFELDFSEGEAGLGEAGSLDPVSEAIARLGADIPTAEAPEGLVDEALETQVMPTAVLAESKQETEEPFLDPDSTHMGLATRASAPDGDDLSVAAAILRRPPPSQAPGEEGVAEDWIAEPPVAADPDLPPDRWRRDAAGSSTDQIPAFRVEGEADIQDRETPQSVAAVPSSAGAATEENQFARSVQHTTGRTAAPWLDPVQEGADEAAHRAPTASVPAVGDLEPDQLDRRPPPKTDPGVPKIAFGTDTGFRQLRDTDPGFPGMDEEAVEQAVIAQTLNEVAAERAERDELIRRVTSAEFDVAVEESGAVAEAGAVPGEEAADALEDERSPEAESGAEPAVTVADEVVTAEEEAVAELRATSVSETPAVDAALIDDESETQVDLEALPEVEPIIAVDALFEEAPSDESPEDEDLPEIEPLVEPDEGAEAQDLPEVELLPSEAYLIPGSPEDLDEGVEPAGESLLEEDLAFAFDAIDAAEEALEAMSSDLEVVTAETIAVGESFEAVAGTEAATVSVEEAEPSADPGGDDEIDTLAFEVYVAQDDQGDDVPLDAVEPAADDRAPAVDPDRDILVSYPYPVAVAHLGFVSEADPAEQCRRLAYTFTAVLKLWAYQILAQYLAEPTLVEARLDGLLRRRLGRPGLADLCELIDEGLRALSSGDVEPFCPELLAAWERLETNSPERVGVPVRVEESPGQVDFRLVELSPIRALTHFCESLIYGKPMSEGAARAQLGVHLPVMSEVLSAGAFMIEYVLCVAELPPEPEAARAEALDTADLMRPDREPSALYAHRLVGAVPSSAAEPVAGVDSGTSTSEVFMVHAPSGRVLPLGAFCTLSVPESPEQAISGLGRELFLLAGLTGEEVFFTSPSGELLAQVEAAPAWRERLASLSPDEGPRIGPEITRLDLIASASAVTRRALRKRADDGLSLAGATLERPEITERLVRFDYGDYRGFVLGGHSGSGKSTLLAQLAEVRLERGDVVLYYSAAQLDQTDLGQRVMSDLGLPDLPMKAFLEGGHELFRPEVSGTAAGLDQPRLFVLVDGVHEHPTNPARLVDDIDLLVGSAASTPWFRLVASIRSSRYAHLSLASRFGRNAAARYLLLDEVSGVGWDRTPIQELPPLSPEELGRLYETYRAWRRPNRIDGEPGLNVMRPQTPFSELDPTGSTCAMMRRPLMLRLASSAFHGRELPSNLSYGEVFGSFLDQVVAEEDNPSGAFPQRRAFLTTLVREMDARSRSWVDREALYEVPSLRDALARTTADSAYTQLLDLGVLVESFFAGRWVVRFAAERLFEFLLAKHLEVGLDSAADVWALAMRAAELPSVRGALGVILLQAARHGRHDLLTESLARIDDEDSGAGRLEAGVITDAVADVLEHLGSTRDSLFGELLPAVTPEARPPMIVPLLFLFERLFRGGAVQAADPVAHRAVELSEQLGDAELISRALCCRAQREEQRGDVEQALATYARALETANESGNLLAAHRINARCGAVLRRQGLREHAFEILDQASDGLAEVGAKSESARAKFEQGELAGEQGDLDAEIALTRESLQRAQSGVDRSIEGRALGKLAWLCLRAGDAEQGLDYQARAQLVAEAEGDFRTLSSMQNLKGLVSWDQDFEIAAQAFVESRDLARRLGDRRALMVASSNLADLRLLQGHLEEAESLVRTAIKLARELTDAEQEAWNLGKLSKVALEAGTLTQAQSLAEEGLERNEKLGSERGQAWALGYLAEVGLEHGQMDVARTLVMRAVEISERSGEMVNLTWLWEILGRSYARMHRLDPAESHFRHIRTAGEKVSSPYAIATGLVGLADVERRRSHWDKAETLLAEALERFGAVGSPVGISQVKRRLGCLMLEQGRYEAARPHLAEAFEVARTLANPRLWAKAHQAMAELLKEQGDVAGAKHRARQALEVRKILDHPLELAESWATVGVCLDLDEEHEEGAEAYAQSLKYAEAVGFEPAIARALFLSASQAIDRGLDAPVHDWAERLSDVARRTPHPLVKAIHAALVARLATLDDDEFKLHNALLDVESAYALLPGHTPVELSPASVYHDAAYFYLSKGRSRRCKEMTKLCRQAAGNRPFPRMAELRKLPKSDHTSDFEAIPT